MIGAIRSEVRKVFTTRLWWGMSVGMALLAGLVAMGFAALVGLDTGQGGPGADAGNPFATMTPGTAQLVYNAGLVQGFTTLVPLAIGSLIITNEYRHKTISATFLATPNRWVVMLSKVVAVAVLGVVLAVAHIVASVVGGASIIGLVKHRDTLLGNHEVLFSFGNGLVAVVVWVVFGFAIGMLIRNQIAAVMVGIGLAFIAQLALNIIFQIKGWYAAMKWLPGNLTSNMLVTSDPTAGQTVDPATAARFFPHWWQAALVLVAYSMVLALVGTVLTIRRDVS